MLVNHRLGECVSSSAGSLEMGSIEFEFKSYSAIQVPSAIKASSFGVSTGSACGHAALRSAQLLKTNDLSLVSFSTAASSLICLRGGNAVLEKFSLRFASLAQADDLITRSSLR